jgi:starch phosphorylase
MVGEYVGKYYQPATRQWQQYSQDGFANARRLAEWKARVRAGWSKVTIKRVDTPVRRVPFGNMVRFEVSMFIDGLDPSDITVELLFARPNSNIQSRPPRHYRMEYQGLAPDGGRMFAAELKPEVCGKIEYRIRAYPYHPLLTHPFEMGMMAWL